MGLASLSVIFSAALGLVFSSPLGARDDPIYQSDHVRFQVRQSSGLPSTGAYADYYLSSYHVAAGTSAAVLTPNFTSAGEYYFNSTRSESVTNQQYLSMVTASVPYDMTFDTGADKRVPVSFSVGPGDRTFYTNAANWLSVNGVPNGPGIFVACETEIISPTKTVQLYWNPAATFTPSGSCEQVYLWQEII